MAVGIEAEYESLRRENADLLERCQVVSGEDKGAGQELLREQVKDASCKARAAADVKVSQTGRLETTGFPRPDDGKGGISCPHPHLHHLRQYGCLFFWRRLYRECGHVVGQHEHARALQPLPG